MSEETHNPTYEATYIQLKKTFEAMFETQIPHNDWWNDHRINQQLHKGVDEGWLARPSVTQVMWTERGDSVIRDVANKMFEGMRTWLENRENERGLKMLDLMQKDYATPPHHGTINTWLYKVNGASTTYLRDEICDKYQAHYPSELDWRNGFVSMDTAKMYAFFPVEHHDYGQDRIVVTAKNKEMFTQALLEGDIIIEGVDPSNDYRNRAYFTIKNYQPELKEGVVFSNSDLKIQTDSGTQVHYMLSMDSAKEASYLNAEAPKEPKQLPIKMLEVGDTFQHHGIEPTWQILSFNDDRSKAVCMGVGDRYEQKFEKETHHVVDQVFIPEASADTTQEQRKTVHPKPARPRR